MKKDFLDEMRGGVEMRYPIKLREKTFFLRPLTVHEKTLVMNIVIEEIVHRPPQQSTAYHEHLALARETLKFASKIDFDDKNPGQINDYVLDRLFEGELLYLYKEYDRIMDKVNPMLEHLSVDEIKDLVEKVKKKGLDPIALSSLQLANIVRHLIQAESPTDN